MTSQFASATQPAHSVEFRNICRADRLLERMQVYERIAERAIELAETRGCKQGYGYEDWSQAESEFLRPVSIRFESSANKIRVYATVAGFDEDELQVSIEPARIIIAGKKEDQPEQGNKLFCVDWAPDEILQVVYLPQDIDPTAARIEFRSGILEFDLLKRAPLPDWTMGLMDG